MTRRRKNTRLGGKDEYSSVRRSGQFIVACRDSIIRVPVNAANSPGDDASSRGVEIRNHEARDDAANAFRSIMLISRSLRPFGRNRGNP